MDNDRLEGIRNTLKPMRVRLFGHEIYQQLETLEDLQEFMEHHVFAVWDNMMQLKALQRLLSCTDNNWAPTEYPQSTGLINQLIAQEESDNGPEGEYISHFDLYRKAMQQAGAQTFRIERFLQLLREGYSFEDALQRINLPESIQKYLQINRSICEQKKPHEILAAYFLGREDVIPQLFHRLADDLLEQYPDKLKTLHDYLTRHIEGPRHDHQLAAALQELCGEDETKWNEAALAAKRALEGRYALWDGILLIAV